MRNTLVAALIACADRPKKLNARRFLLGLSADELQFIAGYLGACILECEDFRVRVPRPQAPRIAADLELKMIVLREYLCRAGVREHAVN
ncbi:MAG: hypothetical protein JWP63_1600 [Candidatus Solibacter sp.]|nr:hypothetical protein [Candidatus Solibacter sp.]